MGVGRPFYDHDHQYGPDILWPVLFSLEDAYVHIILTAPYA